MPYGPGDDIGARHAQKFFADVLASCLQRAANRHKPLV